MIIHYIAFEPSVYFEFDFESEAVKFSNDLQQRLLIKYNNSAVCNVISINVDCQNQKKVNVTTERSQISIPGFIHFALGGEDIRETASDISEAIDLVQLIRTKTSEKIRFSICFHGDNSFSHSEPINYFQSMLVEVMVMQQISCQLLDLNTRMTDGTLLKALPILLQQKQLLLQQKQRILELERNAEGLNETHRELDVQNTALNKSLKQAQNKLAFYEKEFPDHYKKLAATTIQRFFRGYQVRSLNQKERLQQTEMRNRLIEISDILNEFMKLDLLHNKGKHNHFLRQFIASDNLEKLDLSKIKALLEQCKKKPSELSETIQSMTAGQFNVDGSLCKMEM